jgi:hypothetical protein
MIREVCILALESGEALDYLLVALIRTAVSSTLVWYPTLEEA